MLFNSFAFLLVFLPIVTVGFAIIRSYLGHLAAKIFLLLSSFLFYAYARPMYLGVLVASILLNWAVGALMGAADTSTPLGIDKRKIFLWIGLVADISLLCSFKYVDFFVQRIPFLGSRIALPNWDFPLGISFFTLTQVMYLVDTYQGLSLPNSLLDHATFVSMFCYVEAGPLVRSRAIVPQFRASKMPIGRLELVCRGMYLLTIGLAKKVLLADSFASIADAGFGSRADFSTLEAWIFSLAYSFQLYFDFSGYSDMAVGCAWMLGIDIPKNFNAPYISKSITEFWQRWHISLSNFITNYLYTPILRSMGNATLATSVVAVLIAMTIAGLWHGPAWTFVIFGGLHGVALAINQVWKRRKKKLPSWLAWVSTFSFVNASLVFFRSASVRLAIHMLHAMFPHANLLGKNTLQSAVPFIPMLVAPVGVVVAFFFKSSLQLADDFTLTRRHALASAVLLLACFTFMNTTAAKEFVYFAF